MNPWNRLWLFFMWLLVAIALCGRYLAHDNNITAFTLVIVALMGTAVVVGSDRAERNPNRDE